ncbi:MAG: transcription termination/antitermination NusG family protein [Candidatus Sulfotelmatobacter sp.]
MSLDLQHVDGKWIALHVRRRGELRIAALLHEGGYRSFLPVARRNPQFVLFPGYIFCLFRYCLAMSLVKIPGVLGIVSFGNTVGTITEQEIERLEVIDQAVTHPEPWPYMSEGDTVMITDGPFRGLTGYYVREAGKDRLVISVTLLLRSVALEIKREWIKNVASPKNIVLPRRVPLVTPGARAA